MCLHISDLVSNVCVTTANNATPFQPQSGSAWTYPGRLHGKSFGQTPTVVWRMKQRRRAAQVLTTQNYVDTARVSPSTAYAFRLAHLLAWARPIRPV